MFKFILLFSLWISTANADFLNTIDSLVSCHSFATHQAEADFFRNFIHQNSIHLIDNDHIWDGNVLITKCLDHFFEGGPLPHAACGPRATALLKIMQHRGIPCRYVYTYSSQYDDIRGHTFAEVYNAKAGKWEAQDPDFNIAFTLKENRAPRLSTKEIVSIDTSLVCPFTFSKEQKRWEDIDSHLINFYEAVLIPSENLMIINSSKFDLEKKFTNGSKFIPWVKQNYGNVEIKIL